MLTTQTFQKEVPYEELPITNNFMFCKVFSDKEIAKELLERLLHIKIGRIEKCSAEANAQTDGTAKGVRFDVYLEDGKSMFDIEVQMAKKANLIQRARFYQAVCDVEAVDPGDEYDKLKSSYIIFLCPFDMFTKRLPVYSFVYTCEEDSSIRLGDKTKKMFVNFSEYGKIKDEKTKAVLKYFKTGQSSDAFTERVKAALDRIHNNPKYRRQFVTFEDMLRDERREAKREAQKELRAEMQPIIDDLSLKNDQKDAEIASMAAKIAELEAQLAAKS